MGKRIIVGNRVSVMPGAEYHDRYQGVTGIVVQVFGEHEKMVGVKLDNLINPASEKGLFWFVASHLSLEDMEESFMFGNYKRAEITFMDGNNSDRVYHYALYNNAASVGDVVVVSTGHHGLALARITAISDEHLDLVACGREVVARADFSAYTARKEREEKITHLKREMDRRVQRMQQYAIYELMAEKDPELKEMLEGMKRLLIGDTATQSL